MAPKPVDSMRARFEDSFARLQTQSNRLAETDRSIENYDALVAERARLDELRDETREERKQIVSRFEPPAPDIQDDGYRSGDTRVVGKVGAAIGIVALVVAGWAAVRLVRVFDRNPAIEYLESVETVEPLNRSSCQWTVDVTVRNDTDTPLQIQRVETVLNQRMVGALQVAYEPLAPGETGRLNAVWNVERNGDCPTPEQVDHGNLILRLGNRSTVSRAFPN